MNCVVSGSQAKSGIAVKTEQPLSVINSSLYHNDTTYKVVSKCLSVQEIMPRKAILVRI